MILPRVFQHFDVSVPDFGGGENIECMIFVRVLRFFASARFYDHFAFSRKRGFTNAF